MGKDFFLFYFFNFYTHISFSLILAGILRAGKTCFLGNQAVCRICRKNDHIGHAHSESA